MKERIKQLMEAQHMNQQTFATFTGIGTASLSSIFNGRTRPTLNHVDAIIEKFPNVNPLWLLKGIGGMMLSSEDNINTTGIAQQKTTDATVNTQQAGRNNAQSNSANLSAEPLHSNNQPILFPTNNNATNTGAKSLSGFHFETEQKITQPQRKITEIRIFYDDQTWESFVPKK